MPALLPLLTARHQRKQTEGEMAGELRKLAQQTGIPLNELQGNPDDVLTAADILTPDT
jgi:hypothetical protein